MTLPKTHLTPLTQQLSAEFQQELLAIGNWWLEHAIDHEHGGFYGEITNDNTPVADACKSVVLNTRILWFFSELALSNSEPRYRAAAERAFHFLLDHFFDREHGGLFWELNAQGWPANDKKQVYAQAFGIYALCSFYQLTRLPEALAAADTLFQLLETRARDHQHGGYLEAFSRTWGMLDDLRLSEKDLNTPKTMNTHLHILEAYTSLYKANPSEHVALALRHSIDCFDEYIIDKRSYHLHMFLGIDWRNHSTAFSFGHDIECSWLLIKALNALDDPALSQRLTPVALAMAEVCLKEALGPNGELLDTYEFATGHYHDERVWWVQAEALVGFMCAHQHTGRTDYLSAATDLWAFIKTHQIDHQKGEWLWLSRLDTSPEHYKAGAWKCPYHNGRAMLEASRYLTEQVLPAA